MALSQKRRLKKEMIEKVSRQGKNVPGRNIALKYIVIPGQSSAFAFIVPVKTAKNAVIRNKLKRRGQAVVYNLLPRIREGCAGLLFFGKGSAEMKFPEIEREITGLFQKAGLLEGL